MTIVRKADNNPQGTEQSVLCSGCDVELYVMPPAAIRKRIARGVENDEMEDIEAGLLWSQENYFYCKKCQKELDCDEMEEGD